MLLHKSLVKDSTFVKKDRAPSDDPNTIYIVAWLVLSLIESQWAVVRHLHKIY